MANQTPQPLTPSLAPFSAAAAMAPHDRILTTIEMTSHRTMFDYFRQFSSDDNGRYAAQFDMLLGTYCNTLSLVRFLETGLAVACVCTRAPDLAYMNEGTVQFEVQQPMIAREGPHPADQPVHNYMVKRVSRRSLNAAFVVAAEALGLLSEVSLDGTAIASHLRMRAIQQLARNVKTVLDSFERGSVDQMLRILIEKAPPGPLMIPLSRSIIEGRMAGRVARANLVSELKRRIVTDLFIMSKRGVGRDGILNMLSSMINSTQQTLAVPRLTHTDSRGRMVDGVLVVTSTIRQRLLSGILELVDTEAVVPVTYGEMMITGTNLVTAVILGKAVRNMDDVARYILSLREEQAAERVDEVLQGLDERPQTDRVKAELVTIGDKLIFLEALERRVYQATQVQYPLVGNVDLTFLLPLGFYQGRMDRYARHSGDYAPEHGSVDARMFPPQRVHFYNKDGQLQELSLADSIGTLCHPSFLEVDPTLEHLRASQRDLGSIFGAYVSTHPVVGLEDAVRNFYDRWWQMLPETPRWVLESNMTAAQFLSTGNANLGLELHPAFDFFVVPADVEIPGPQTPPQVMAGVAGTWRVCNGNIPLPLCSSDFRDARGAELASHRHRLSTATIEAVTATFTDTSYPAALYLVEALVHGSERMFGVLSRLIIQCIRSYWDNSRRVAFVNSFPMVAYIETYLAGGELPEECTNIYKDLMRHTRALRALVTEFTCQGEAFGEQGQEEINHMMTDRTLLPPLIWDCDALVYRAAAARDRTVSLSVGGAQNYSVRPWADLQEVDFRRTGNTLIHNRPVRNSAEHRQRITPHHDVEWTTLSKIYYFAVVPAFSRGNCCTMGVRYDNVYATAQSVVVPEVAADEEPALGPEDPRHPLNGRNLVPNTFNVLFHNGRLSVDADAMLTLQEVINNMAERTTGIMCGADPDVGASVASTRNLRTFDGTLHHGLLMMAYPHNDETILAGTYFYPAPVNALFACHDHLASMPGLNENVRNSARDVPPVPTFLGANYYSSVRQPVAKYVRESRCDPNDLSYALMACYFKFGPVALTHQLRTGLHPGFALTVLRQDRFLADSGLFAERASESYFLGQISVTRRPHAGGVQFSLTQPRANVDLGVGYTAVSTPLLLRTAVTDMGRSTQSLYLTRGSAPMLDAAVDEYLRRTATQGQSLAPQRAVPFLGTLMPNRPAGLQHGQRSICEFIVTPVSADLEYFRTSCNPRGRSAGTVYSGEEPSDAEEVMYDHSQGDPAYPFRATINPWASQRFSYADRLYNGLYNLSGASPLFSPTYKFFTASEVISRTRCLSKLIVEAGAATMAFGSDGEVQFRRPPGSTELTEDPCALFQEAFPLFCATDRALLRTHNSAEPANAETHMAQYLIRDTSPVAGCLPA
ncbi:major capsid protein [Falconid herpesvirus 1]|uniref:Major capsid protein n=1 Tax=Falconid herpesvirus 1 TaxID=1510155 RepID=A0A068EP61_9ALPH|nr:major capsid protein [Falconid herpesvirus 1]AID52721.1 major capsid protein [Falconid herpesvirus 1]